MNFISIFLYKWDFLDLSFDVIAGQDEANVDELLLLMFLYNYIEL